MSVSLDELTQRRPYNAAADFVDANVAAGRAGKAAFIDPTRSLSYGALQEATCRFARGLQQLGLRAESRVLLLMLDTVDYPVAFWAALRAGIVPIPLNTLLTPEQYAYIFADSRAEAIVVSAPLLALIEPVLARLEGLRTLIVAGADGALPQTCASRPCQAFESVAASGAADVWTAPTVSDEVAFWLYSSGSTGEPKGTRHIQSSLIATARLYG
ncbi:MAG TPA: AMP-binding protein, partial [Xanthobacteraceae bacterium]